MGPCGGRIWVHAAGAFDRASENWLMARFWSIEPRRGGRKRVRAGSTGRQLMAGVVAGLLAATALPGIAQQTGQQAGQQAIGADGGPFGGVKHDSSAPIEITSDALEVRQAEQLAIFSGDVVAGQGSRRLTADRVEVSYDEQADDPDTGAI